MPIEHRELDQIVGPKPGPIPPFCVRCGYNLLGAVSTRCPECGQTFVAKEWQQRAAEYVHFGNQIRTANEWADRGLYIAVAAALVTAFRFAFAGSCMSEVCRILVAITGVCCVFLGIGTYRVPRLPDWVTEQLAPQPKRDIGSILILAGLVFVGVSAF